MFVAAAVSLGGAAVVHAQGADEPVDVADAPGEPDPEALAQTLGIVDTDEAALLIVGEGAIDSLQVGNRDVVVAPPIAGEGLYQVVRGQTEGIVAVTIRRGEQVWEGQLQTFAGQVTVVDAEEGLRGASAAGSPPAVDAEFDLFGFYDELDVRESDADKLEYCTQVQAGALSDADRTVVAESCRRIEAAVAAANAPEVEEDPAEDLSEMLLEDPDLLADVRPDRDHQLLYRRDGRPRLVARGTAVRWIVAGASAVGTGIATYSAVFWEYRAEQEYVLFRDAERVGEDSAMTQHLFFSKRYDANRDASIGTASAFLTSTIVSVIVQAAEGRRFQRRRAALLAARDDRD